MQSDLTICCDIDGVIADILPAMEKGIEKQFNVRPLESKKNERYLEDRYEIERVEIRKFLEEVLFEDPEFWYECAPIEANIKSLMKWWDTFRVGRLFLVTGRGNVAREATVRWMSEYNVSYTALLMGTLDSKDVVMDYVGADFIIEDRLTESVKCVETGHKAYLIAYPHNVIHKAEYLHLDNLIWVNGLSDIEKKEEMY